MTAPQTPSAAKAGLKPCPFCGGETVIQRDDMMGLYDFMCRNAKADIDTCPTSGSYSTEEAAARAANRRAEASPEGLVELVAETWCDFGIDSYAKPYKERGFEAKEQYRARARAILQRISVEPSNGGTPEALCDSAYIAGAKAGYNLGVDENHEGLAKLIESRAGYLSVISALEPGKAGTPPEEWREVMATLVQHVQEWCDAVDRDTSWDGWDHHYKNFAYNGGLEPARRLLAAAPTPAQEKE